MASLLSTTAFAQGTPDTDAPADEDVITAAIGCIATYDMVLAKGAGLKAGAIRTARESAVEVYKEYSGLSDEDISAAIAKADQLFPSIVAHSQSTLADYEQSCNDAFMDVTAIPATTQTGWIRPRHDFETQIGFNLRASERVPGTFHP